MGSCVGNDSVDVQKSESISDDYKEKIPLNSEQIDGNILVQLIVAGYFRIYVEESAPKDILNLCIEFFKSIQYDECKSGDKVLIEHCNDNSKTKFYLTASLNLYSTIDNEYIFWTLFQSDNDYVSFKSSRGAYLSVDHTGLGLHIGNYSMQQDIPQHAMFKVNRDYARNGIYLESVKYPGQYLKVASIMILTIDNASDIRIHPDHYVFNVI